MADTPGSAADIKIVVPASRQPNMDAVLEQQTEVYQSLSLSQKLQKQHRTFAAAFQTMEIPAAVPPLATIAGAAYNQAAFQAVIDKIDAVIAQQAAMLQLLEFQKAVSASNIVKPT